jgi:hypothetical protein
MLKLFPGLPKRNARFLCAINGGDDKAALRPREQLGYTPDAMANGFELIEAIHRFCSGVVLMVRSGRSSDT